MFNLARAQSVFNRLSLCLIISLATTVSCPSAFAHGDDMDADQMLSDTHYFQSQVVATFADRDGNLVHDHFDITFQFNKNLSSPEAKAFSQWNNTVDFKVKISAEHEADDEGQISNSASLHSLELGPIRSVSESGEEGQEVVLDIRLVALMMHQLSDPIRDAIEAARGPKYATSLNFLALDAARSFRSSEESALTYKIQVGSSGIGQYSEVHGQLALNVSFDKLISKSSSPAFMVLAPENWTMELGVKANQATAQSFSNGSAEYKWIDSSSNERYIAFKKKKMTFELFDEREKASAFAQDPANDAQGSQRVRGLKIEYKF